MDKMATHYLGKLKAHYTPPSVGQRAKMVSYILTYTMMTQTELAKAIGCSQGHINQLVFLAENAVDDEFVAMDDLKYSVNYAYRKLRERMKKD